MLSRISRSFKGSLGNLASSQVAINYNSNYFINQKKTILFFEVIKNLDKCDSKFNVWTLLL